MSYLTKEDRYFDTLIFEYMLHELLVGNLLHELEIKPASARDFISADRFSMMCFICKEPISICILPAKGGKLK